jgi:hypothetical protein
VTDEPRNVAEARQRAEEARGRLIATFDQIVDRVEQLQQQLAPSNLVRDAWDAAKSKSVDLAEDAVDAVRQRPVAATGAVAALALFIAREPLMELAGKLAGDWTTKSEAKRARKRSSKKQAEPSDTETA